VLSRFSPLIGVALALLLDAGAARAFHRGGAGSCRACHTTHESEDGVPVESGEMLLRFQSGTDLCLSCHANALGEVFASDPLAPAPERGGGNFAFLLEDNIADGPGGASSPIPGSHAGHNVVSLTWGVPVDPDYPVAPGGSYPAAALGCTSCHDPHGNGNFRMLYGAGPVVTGDFQFVNPAPLAEGIDIVSGQETASSHSAYLSGWSESQACAGRWRPREHLQPL
jgi:predicted CXXCH cytochrome family protein